MCLVLLPVGRPEGPSGWKAVDAFVSLPTYAQRRGFQATRPGRWNAHGVAEVL